MLLDARGIDCTKTVITSHENRHAPLPPLRSVKVLDQLRERIRYLHYSLPTEQAYVHWVRAFIRFHGVRHPATLGSSEVEAFLSWLANERKVSVSTHRQALAALLFFYGKVLCTDRPGFRRSEDLGRRGACRWC